MNFVALILGLGVERLLTHLFHLREFRWLDPLFGLFFRTQRKATRRTGMLLLILFTALIVAPVALASGLLAGTLFQVPYFLLAVFVLLFSLGPRDLTEEVNDYCMAVNRHESDDLQKHTRELIERDPPEDSDEHAACVERALFIQANNRIFGVVFWFIVLGPTGAWLFRVLDLMRRRQAFQSSRGGEQQAGDSLVWAIWSLHGVFAWLPARLLAIGYALAGSFDDAISNWRNHYGQADLTFFEATENLMASVGGGALGAARESGENPDAAVKVRDAMDLVNRTLWLIWCPVIAVLTLADWLT